MLTQEGNCVLNQEEAMRAIIEESWLKQPVWYKLYKTALVRDILFPVEKYHEDVFWSYQAVGSAKKVSVSDHVGYYYLQRGGSIMGAGYSLTFGCCRGKGSALRIHTRALSCIIATGH